MNKRTLFILVLFSVFGISFAQEQSLRINTHFQEILPLSNPILHTANPAAISYNSLDSIKKVEINARRHNGDFKPSLSSEKGLQIGLHTESFRRINQTMLYGAFNQSKDWETGVDYSNVYDAYRGSPYLLIDSVRGSHYEREQYSIETIISHQFTPHITLAASIDYAVGLGAQNKDPRALNKLINLKNKIGIIAEGELIKIGFDAYYNYLNEDIDLKTIRNNTTFNLYTLTGLGTYSKIGSDKYYRLYKGFTHGYDFQFEIKNNILEIGVELYTEKALDGLSKSGPTISWSSIKKDSYFNTTHWHLKDIFTLQRSLNYHQFIVGLERREAVGEELTQQLELVHPDYNISQWKTLIKEDKYSKTNDVAQLSYTYSKLKAPHLRNYSLGASAQYLKQDEVYNFQGLKADFQNINYNLNASKLFQFKQHSIETKADINYHVNISKTRQFNYSTNITEWIIIPDFEYFSSNRLGGALMLNYTYTNKQGQHYSVECNYEIAHSRNAYYNNENRHYTTLTLGLMF